MNKITKIIGVLFFVMLDQVAKILTYFFMEFGKTGHINIVGDLFGLTYVLNPGMIFGLQFGTKYGKILLILIRIILCFFVGYKFLKDEPIPLLYDKHSKNKKWSLFALTIFLAGAIGNTIDGLFYGLFLHNAPIGSPFNFGYGQVIDMLDLHVYDGYLPQWLPIWGGKYVSLFPVGNIADVLIMLGIVIMLFNNVEDSDSHDSVSNDSHIV